MGFEGPLGLFVAMCAVTSRWLCGDLGRSSFLLPGQEGIFRLCPKTLLALLQPGGALQEPSPFASPCWNRFPAARSCDPLGFCCALPLLLTLPQGPFS